MLNLPCRDLLVARYPIRKKDDLLPLFSLGTRETLALLNAELGQAGCGMSEALLLDHVVGRQLRLEGTLVLHSETARRNGGDYDFDYVCVVEGDKFPRFVGCRFAHGEGTANEKNKRKKNRSPWRDLLRTASKDWTQLLILSG